MGERITGVIPYHPGILNENYVVKIKTPKLVYIESSKPSVNGENDYLTYKELKKFIEDSVSQGVLIDLSKASLPGIDLRGVVLKGVDFTLANLSNAMLQGADLTEAIVDKADLTNANLIGAKYNQGQFQLSNMTGVTYK
jgi:uncharacterized protein YjbI with pentapeptide repeats